jgi:hypothetical protein
MEKREPMRTRHVSESTLVGVQYAIGSGTVSDIVGCSEEWIRNRPRPKHE